jgi:ADP-ribose pyrophosphatase
VILILTNQEGKILINKEYRMAMGQWIYNFPAGLIDPGETPQQAAKRELKEETGLDLITIDDILFDSYSAVGFSNEKNIVIVGTAEGTFHESTSTSEEIEAKWYTKKEVRQLLKSQYFAARTQAYCYLWAK